MTEAAERRGDPHTLAPRMTRTFWNGREQSNAARHSCVARTSCVAFETGRKGLSLDCCVATAQQDLFLCDAAALLRT
jgi:hypothetical protein